MSFYADLSRYYDEIFPANAAEMAFVNRQLRGKARLLDIGCGTGNKTELLATAHNEIMGIDADPAMIDAARASHGGPRISYAVRDMRDIGGLGPGVFDGVVCLGNTLVHLESQQAVRAFLDAVHGLMRPGDVFIVQILHYEWIIAGNVTRLPQTDTDHVTFTRDYVWQGAELHFRTALLNKQTGAKYTNDIVLLPLLTAELAEMLAETGFTNIRHFGDYQGGPLKEDSLASIIVCDRV